MENKAEIAAILAKLLGKPDEGLIAAINSGELYRTLAAEASLAKADVHFLQDAEYTLESLTGLYHVVTTPGGSLLPFAESVYKPWADDYEHFPGLSGKKGYLMGDPAMHMLDLYRRFGVEIPEEFSSQPDHLVLELEFLSLLYELYPETMIARFMHDHLDWLRDLLTRASEISAPSFYCSVLRLIDAFIRNEKFRLEELHEMPKEVAL